MWLKKSLYYKGEQLEMTSMKEVISKCMKWINDYTSKHLEKEGTSPNKQLVHYSFQSLTPTDEVDMRVYEDALNHAFKDNDIKNIALSGSYGSGKSSVLKSYKKISSKHKFIHISLAHFEEHDTKIQETNDEPEKSEITSNKKSLSKTKEVNENNKSRFNENALEGKILNQLLHQIPAKNIPQTNFRVKEKVSFSGVFWRTCEIVSLVGLFLLLTKFDTWKAFIKSSGLIFEVNLIQIFSKLNMIHSFVTFAIFTIAIYFGCHKKGFENKKVLLITVPLFVTAILIGVITKEIALLAVKKGQNLVVSENFLTSPILQFVAGILFTVILFTLLFRLIKTQKNKNFLQKISVQGNTIEIFEKSDESYFDKYLNEVLYIFENSGKDIIVFEDIDRFNTGKIFERLHEINTLVNVRLKDQNKPSLKFLYLLRDDVFVNKDRTKFFDLIIPVVPVVDGSNSYKALNKLLVEGGTVKNFDTTFLKKISLYIDEMRLLKNIVNEFLVYYNKLIILSDETTLDLKPEKMFAMVTYKNIFPKDFSSLQLGRGYVHTLFSKKDELIKLKSEIKLSEIKNIESRIVARDECFITSNELNTIYHAYNNHNYGENKKWIDEKYPVIMQAIEDKLSNNISILEERKSTLEKELADINSLKISDLAKTLEQKDVFLVDFISNMNVKEEFNDIKDSARSFDLLVFLIREGKIAEDYSDYMTFFDVESIKPSDKNFLLSITDRRDNRPYEYALLEPQKIIDILSVTDFDQSQILNFSLINYLLNNKSNKQYLSRFLDQIKNTKNFNFIEKYMAHSNFDDKFVFELNLLWKEVFLYAIRSCKQGDFSAEDKIKTYISEKTLKKYILLTFKESSIDTIKVLNVDNCIRDYISHKPDFLEIDTPEVDKIITALVNLEVSFVSINHNISNSELLRQVYIKNLYELTFENISMFLTLYYVKSNEYDLVHENYTLVQLETESPLSKRINDKFSHYMDIVFNNCGDKINDKQDIAISVLNKTNDDLSLENKLKYINLYSGIIQSINNVEDKALWDALFEKVKVKYSEKNIIYYYIEKMNTLTPILIKFINSNEQKLNFNNIKGDGNEGTINAFFNSVIACNELSDIKYLELISTLDIDDSEIFTYENIEESKIQILIENNFIHMNTSNLAFIRENYSQQILEFFIKTKVEDYCNILDSYSYIKSDVEYLLSEDIGDDIKIRLLEQVDDTISVVNKNYSPNIELYILQNKLMTSDLIPLAEDYKKQHKEVKAKIAELLYKYHSEKLYEKGVSKELLEDLLSSKSITENEKKYILGECIHNFNKTQIKSLFKICGFFDFIKIFDSSEGEIEFSGINEILLTALKQNNIISEFEANEDNTIYNVREKNIAKFNDIILD